MIKIFFQISICSYSYFATTTPQIIERSLDKSETICINTSKPYTAVIFNSWKYSNVDAYYSNSTEEIIPYLHSGTFSEENQVGGFDFANNTGYVIFTAISSTKINFGLYVYPPNGVRVMSNDPSDHLSLDDSSDDALLIQNNQHLEYFNSAPTKQKYEIDISTEQDTDILSFFYSDQTYKDYSGNCKTTVTASSDHPVVVIWKTNKETISAHAKILITSKFDPKYFVRVVTNDDKFMPIPVFKSTSLLKIIIIVIVTVVVFICLLIVIIYILARRAFHKAKMERKDGKYQKASRLETEGENALDPSMNSETVCI